MGNRITIMPKIFTPPPSGVHVSFARRISIEFSTGSEKFSTPGICNKDRALLDSDHDTE